MQVGIRVEFSRDKRVQLFGIGRIGKGQARNVRFAGGRYGGRSRRQRARVLSAGESEANVKLVFEIQSRQKDQAGGFGVLIDVSEPALPTTAALELT